MPKLLRRILVVLVILLIVLGLAGGGVALTFTAILPPQSLPKIDGELQLAGLNQPVDIYRDTMGIPHIYAATGHDLFFAQGYVHAQDRFWQMDFWRHIGSGRLAEMFGKSQLDTDIFLRRMGWARVAQQELAVMDPETMAILQAYSEGVNAYLKDHNATAVSLEYGVLKLLTPGYSIEPWTPLHTLTWAKAMAWDLRGNMDEEGERAVLLKLFTPEQVNQLYPPYPGDHPFIVASNGQTTSPLAPAAATEVKQVDGLQTQASDVNSSAKALDNLLGPSGAGVGSNNWVISGKLTASGKPLLANDPHLGSQMPSIWYEIGLHCRTQSADCPFEVVGFSFPGAPGVIIGHNARIAWGFTNVGPDVQDIYIEKINPANPNQYEVNGKWVDMQTLTETVKVAGGQDQTITVRYTRHGPILWEDDKAVQEFQAKSGIELPAQYRLALRWTALEVSHTFPAIWQMNKASNWDEFRKAASNFDVPAQNFVYADVDGNIGYQMPGHIPLRASGDGRTYVPGWTDAYEWTGYIPFEKLPHAYNPPKGYIATANNQVIKDYPYLIGSDFDYGYRAQRIVEMITKAPGKIDATYIQKMQGDNRNLRVDYLLPALKTALAQGQAAPAVTQAAVILDGWDGQQGMDSPQAALFEAFWKHLMSDTFGPKLPKDMQPDGGGRWWEVVRNLVQQPDSFWWDDPKTAEKETSDAALRNAFAAGLKELQSLQGSDPAQWNWGKIHTLTFQNKTLGKSGVAPIEALFNRGPYPTAGGKSIVNATGWDTSVGFEVDWLPSMRMIVDMSDLTKSLSVHTTGQSGHAFAPHYTDMIDMWRTIQYHPMRWDAQDIEKNSEGHLHLLP
jgi:penicillin amidase